MGISSSLTRHNKAMPRRFTRNVPLGTSPAGPRTLMGTADRFGSPCVTGVSEADKDKAALARAQADWPVLAGAAARHGIDPGLLAAVAVRESGYRNVHQPDGMGRGVFQIDIGRNPDVSEAQAMDVAWAANWAAARLSSNLKYMLREYPHFTKAEALQAAVAAYNRGRSPITKDPATIDRTTPGNNYGRNVRDIATCF